MADTPAPPPEPSDPATKKALAEAALAKAQADARKAGADADTAVAGAKTATLKALIGEIPAAPYSGGVTATDGAALAEHNQLARKRLDEVGKSIAAHLADASKGTHVYLTADDAGPPIAAAEMFALHTAIVARALRDALTVSVALDAPATPITGDDSQDFLPVVATAGLVLSGLNAAMSYLKSDQSLGGRELKPGEQALLTAVAHGLLKSGRKVWLGAPTPAAAPQATKAILDELADLSSTAADARIRAAHHASSVALLTPPAAPAAAATVAPKVTGPDASKAGNVADGAGKASVLDPHGDRPKHERALAELNAAIALFDELQSALLAVTDGVSALLAIARARSLKAFLDEPDASVAIVKLDGAYGSTLSSKNMLTTVFGTIPYKLSIQLQASWRCFSGSDLHLIGSGLENSYRPFTKVDDIA